MATGRTVSKYFKFQLDDSGGTVRDLAVSSINGVGLTFDQIDLTAFQDAVKGALSGTPDWTLELSGPFSNLAVAGASGSGAVPVLSGSHLVLSDLPGGVTPLTFGCYFGIAGHWTTGDPAFGLTSDGTNGALCFDYTVDPESGLYTASFRMFPGSTVPAWGTAAFT